MTLKDKIKRVGIGVGLAGLLSLNNGCETPEDRMITGMLLGGMAPYSATPQAAQSDRSENTSKPQSVSVRAVYSLQPCLIYCWRILTLLLSTPFLKPSGLKIFLTKIRI